MQIYTLPKIVRIVVSVYVDDMIALPCYLLIMQIGVVVAFLQVLVKAFGFVTRRPALTAHIIYIFKHDPLLFALELLGLVVEHLGPVPVELTVTSRPCPLLLKFYLFSFASSA